MRFASDHVAGRLLCWLVLSCPVLLPACAHSRKHAPLDVQSTTALPNNGPESGIVQSRADEPAPQQPKTAPKHDHAHEPKQEDPLPTPSFPVPDDMSPIVSVEELEQLALANNPTLVAAGMQIEGARARAIQARLWPNPTVGYVGDQIGQKGTVGEFQGVFVEQEIITAFKRRLSAAKYKQEIQTAEFNALGQQLKVLNGVRMHAFKVVAAGRMVRLREALLKNATEEYRTTLEEHNIGRKDKAEVLLAQNRRNEAQIEWLREKTITSRCGVSWRRWWGSRICRWRG